MIILRQKKYSGEDIVRNATIPMIGAASIAGGLAGNYIGGKRGRERDKREFEQSRKKAETDFDENFIQENRQKAKAAKEQADFWKNQKTELAKSSDENDRKLAKYAPMFEDMYNKDYIGYTNNADLASGEYGEVMKNKVRKSYIDNHTYRGHEHERKGSRRGTLAGAGSMMAGYLLSKHLLK